MKKLIGILVLVFAITWSYADSKPGNLIKIANRTTHFSVPVAKGDNVQCISDSTFWSCQAWTDSIYSINTARANFSLVNKPSGTGTVVWVSGTAPIVVSGNSTSAAVSITQSSSTSNGYLSSTDWNTFNNKEPTVTKGNLTESSSSVLTITGGTGAVIGSGTAVTVKQSSSTSSGFLSSTDWSTFNGKESAFTDTTQLFIVPSDGIGGIACVLYGTPIAGSLTVSYNPEILTASRYALATKTITIAGTVWKGDRVIIKYRYR